jgi:hypothetical protein
MVHFERDLAPKLKLKAFEAKLSQRLWFEKILWSEKQVFCFLEVKL